MKKILVISDTHGFKKGVDKLFESIDLFDHVYFLGDGYGDIEDYLYAFPDKVDAVIGNCDTYYSGPTNIINKVEDVTILLTHGHAHHIKYGYETLVYFAKNNGVDLALFGHTHSPTDTIEEGVRLINPGTLGSAYFKGTYSILTINGKEVHHQPMSVSALLGE